MPHDKKGTPDQKMPMTKMPMPEHPPERPGMKRPAKMPAHKESKKGY